MRTGRAFELNDLTVLLELDLSEPSDAGDIEAIDAILTRRRTDRAMPTDSRSGGHRRTLRLVPNVSP